MKESVKWLSSTDDSVYLTQNLLISWLVVGQKKKTISDNVLFCDAEILDNILNLKTMFDNVNHNKFMLARSASNPFETIGRSIFQNRAAVKIANMDAILNFMFTDPKDENGKSLVTDLLYFADVCAGPGGFSEYVLWRKNWMAKGFGITLRNACDIKLEALSAGKKETFDAYYGIKGDGNITDPANIISFRKHVLSRTNGTGVHFMMADGGFYVKEKNIQEIAHKHLYLCQCVTGLVIVRDGGSIVTKLFDIFTIFSVGLIYLMYKCFKEIAIINQIVPDRGIPNDI